MKRALITGITGQDGSYLAEFLLHKGYEVHGLVRRASTFNRSRIDHLYLDPHDPECHLFLHYGDLADAGHLAHLLYEIQPEEIYHLGAQSHVKVSFELPEYTADVTGLGTLRILEAIRKSKIECRFYQASSSEMFGEAPSPQNEHSPFLPQSPYALSKVFAYHITRIYREAYGIYAVNGILFNHESPRRGESFVTRKITMSLAKIRAGVQKKLYIGNLDAKRDWGFAPEYVEWMWKMLQMPKADDYVIGTGESHSVQEFLVCAFGYVGLPMKDFVVQDKRFYRPLEVKSLKADIQKAKKVLGVEPRVTFAEIVKIMVDADMEALGLTPPGEGKALLQAKRFDWLQKP